MNKITKYYRKIYKIIKRWYSDYIRQYVDYNRIARNKFEWNKILINYFHKDRPLNWKDIKRKIKLFISNKIKLLIKLKRKIKLFFKIK